MMTRHPSFMRAVVSGLLCLLALFAAPAAMAQTITNIASASWQQAGQVVTTQSNAVSFVRMSSAATITTYAAGAGASTSLSFTPSQCGGAAIAVSGNGASPSQIASVAQTTVVQIGSVFYFEVAAPQADTNPQVIDSIQVILTTNGGDRETLTVFETAPNSGLFVGAVPTAAVPPQPVQGDCHLSVAAGNTISIAALLNGSPTPIAIATLQVANDPFGFVFDSESGASVNGASVTIVNAITGQPAAVLAPDGVTPWPATVVTGSPVVDGSGMPFQLAPGEYLFPLVPPGQYRLKIAPPAPYTAPSSVSPANLAGILRPDGTPVQISTASYGAPFTISGAQPLRVDVPVDKPGLAATITKMANRSTAQEGDVVFYTVQVGNPEANIKRNVTVLDHPALQLRIRPQSVRIDGVPAQGQVQFSRDGRDMTLHLGAMAPASSHVITYAATVNQNAAPGQAPNTVSVTDSLGLTATSHAVVQVIADMLTDRMTLIGRITDGGCMSDRVRHGIAGVRVMLEDGSYAVTDKDGRYHFDGLVPGDHVAQVAPTTLPEGGAFVDCSRSTRSAGSAISRFVSGQGGMLTVADFYATLPPAPARAVGKDGGKDAPLSAASRFGPAAISDKAAAGTDVDWLAMGDGPTAFLFPAVDHNPRSPAVRVVIRHRDGQKIELSANGVPVPHVAFDGIKVSANHTYAVSVWSGIPLDGYATHLVALVRNRDGSVAQTLTRDVYFANVAAQVRLVPEQTHLVADASTRPVIALRILDRNGRPVHRGMAGDIAISAPYESAEVVNALQQRSLAGEGRATPHWTVEGDDGMAYVELAPTMVSGAIHLDFLFDDGGPKRHQTIDSWVVPGDLPWTLVGLAEGALGSQSIADRMERSGTFESDLGRRARTAFYAKGRILGKYLLTVAYDSAKQSADQTLTGAISPNRYYTVFADGSNRRFDAASRNKLYVRIEAKGFYALFGDFSTALTQTNLARYQRTMTGISAEASIGRVRLKGFGAKTSTTHRHLELQGGGVTGPYSLGTVAMVADSETVSLQVRDRFQSGNVVSTTTLTRFIDYDIDVLSGTITFKQPVLSHDAGLDPQFIVIDFDVDPALGAAANAFVGGGRAEWTNASGHLKIGMTAISDVGANGASPTARTSLGALDAKLDLSATTSLRAEAGASRTLGATAQAWLVEAEHHGRAFDMLAYVRSADPHYGLGETGNAEIGWRKYGLDAKLHVSRRFSLVTSLWREDSLTAASSRKALQMKAQYRLHETDFHLGISAIQDQLASVDTTTTTTTTTPAGTTSTRATTSSGPINGTSTVIEAGVSRKFLHDKLQIDATISHAIGSASSIDLPANQTIAARYTVNPRLKLIASYDVATGQTLNTRTARAGFEYQPWKGAKLTSSLGNQDVAEYGPRSFAAFGLTQSLGLTHHLTLDATVDANKVLSGFDAAHVLNPAQPVVNGGQLNGSGTLTENFTAVTLGAGWKQALWSATLRGELRNGEFADRRGLTGGLIRQLGDGEVLGAGMTATGSRGTDGSRSAVLDASVAYARRPAEASYALLAKIEYRADTLVAPTTSTLTTVTTGGNTTTLAAGSISGVAGTAGDNALTLGNQRARRLIGSVSADWSPRGHNDDDELTQRSEVSVFAAMRYNFDAYDGYNLAGTTAMGGVDAHIGIGSKIEIGARLTARANLSDHTASFAFGPSIGLVPAKNVLVTLGYNVTGFRDPDFSASRSTTRGVYVTLRMKLDTSTFAFLGLDGRAR
jgi:fimbrial isopeptide formation D2 family protein